MRMRQRGVSIVEALVALVVLSIGLLGIAGLFVESLRSSRTALLRTHAVNLASDIADRIRANASARDAYETATYGGAPAAHNCAPTASEAGRNCTVAELAEDDLASWQEAVSLALPALPDPANAAVVEFEAGAAGRPDRYLITVAWQEPGARGAEEYRYTSELVIMERPPI
ncbi:MAG TPA: type IV pilus modification protein PilV [Steroidobacteraceae bacterium]|nr:type IV pilus modification protein PilV [Steroidobacteraceae bacterium]